MPVSRDPRLRLMGQCGRFICVCYDVTCVCVGGGIFLLLAQNLISILRKMHQHSLSVPQNRPCHAELQSLPMRADQTVRAPTPSILIEEAALSLSEQPAFVGVDQIKAA